MILAFKMLFYRLSQTRNMKLFLAHVDNDFNAAVIFSLMTNCLSFPFHVSILHPVIPVNTKGNQSSHKPINSLLLRTH